MVVAGSRRGNFGGIGCDCLWAGPKAGRAEFWSGRKVRRKDSCEVRSELNRRLECGTGWQRECRQRITEFGADPERS